MAGAALKVFKFQSDSINTDNNLHSRKSYNPLNSNLILLILIMLDMLFFLQPTLNSNLILLIPEDDFNMLDESIRFKFQSDSINTSCLLGYHC